MRLTRFSFNAAIHTTVNGVNMDGSCESFETKYVGASVVILFSCGARAFFMFMEDLTSDWAPFVDSDVYAEPLVPSFPPPPSYLNIDTPPCPHQPHFYSSISQWCLKFCSPLKVPYWLVVRGFPDRSQPSLQWTASARRVQSFIPTCGLTATSEPTHSLLSGDMLSQRISKIFLPQLVRESSIPEGLNFEATPVPQLDGCRAEAQDAAIPLSTMSAPEGFRDFDLVDPGVKGVGQPMESNIRSKTKVAGKRKSRCGPREVKKGIKCANAMKISHIVADEPHET